MLKVGLEPRVCYELKPSRIHTANFAVLKIDIFSCPLIMRIDSTHGYVIIRWYDRDENSAESEEFSFYLGPNRKF